MDKRRRLNGVVGKVVVVCVKRGGDRVPSNFVTIPDNHNKGILTQQFGEDVIRDA